MQITPTVEPLRAPLRRGAMRVVVAALLLLLTGGPASARQDGPPEESNLQAAYNAAIYDASVYKFSNLRQLRPLEFDPKTGTAKVVQLTDYRGYTLGENKLGRSIWVTAVPEVQERCQGFSGDLEMRLRQLFGFPPDQRVTHFVVMNVKEKDIFRPTVDDDTKTVLPCACPMPVNCGEVFPADVTGEHVRWFADQMLSSYLLREVPTMRSGFPWTRLGYTYDWKPGADRYGASEYVIRPASTVTVTAIIPLKQYCSPAP
ncbi:MAG: hypothetical protein M3416_19925 [Acidobacteriota bacterium]|nr:hypothetical protein [Acidobacteriota bacterium]